MKKVTVINAYGEKNMGDMAILEVALELIKKAYGNDCKISVLCENKKTFTKYVKDYMDIIPFDMPYGHAIRGSSEKVTSRIKILRFISIFVKTYYFVSLNQILKIELPKKAFYSYIAAIKDADVIIGVGGGYLITKSIKDYFGLFLTLLPIYISKLYKKRIIFLPISFGPFSTPHQESLTYNALKDTTVIARDNITLKQLEDNDTQNRIKKFYAPDLALFFKQKYTNRQTKLSSKYIVLTAREWLTDGDKQNNYEESLASCVNKVWDDFKLKTVFIPMAKNAIEDDDNRVAKRIQSKLSNKDIFKVEEPANLESLQRILGGAKLAICTRMHSAIISSSTHTPFIAIGYGHKTLGFVKSFNIADWHIDINDVTSNILNLKTYQLLQEDNYNKFIDTIEKKQSEIAKYKEVIINELRLN